MEISRFFNLPGDLLTLVCLITFQKNEYATQRHPGPKESENRDFGNQNS